MDSITSTVHANSHAAAQEQINWRWSWFDNSQLRTQDYTIANTGKLLCLLFICRPMPSLLVFGKRTSIILFYWCSVSTVNENRLWCHFIDQKGLWIWGYNWILLNVLLVFLLETCWNQKYFFPLGASSRRFTQNKSSGKKSIGKRRAPTLSANYYSQ